ncbi:MAG: hypothetical protein PHR16_02985 [Methylovulum sp.]|nr:hypothetical protein [Methylovulum sp.]
MKKHIKNKSLTKTCLVLAGMFSISLAIANQDVKKYNPPSQPLKVNQTEAYAPHGLSALTFHMNFACVHSASSDLDYNGKIAAIDPAEYQTPICSFGPVETNVTGAPLVGDDDRDSVSLIVPWFDSDHDNEGHGITSTQVNELIRMFGYVPDAYEQLSPPGIPVQCPEPGLPRTKRQGEFGTCTMQNTSFDVGPGMVKLGLLAPNSRFVTSTPNRSLIINADNLKPKWRQIKATMVIDSSEWPDAEGTKGITTVQGIRDCQARGHCAPNLPTNIFLYFSAKAFKN